MEDIQKYVQKILDDKNISYNYDEMVQDAQKDSEVQKFIAEHQSELAADAVNKSAANIYEFVKQRNKILQNKNSTVAGFLPKLFVNNGLLDVQYEPTRATLEQENSRKKAQKIRLIDLPSSLINADINEFDRTPERLFAYSSAVEFLSKMKQIKDGRSPKGLYFSGNFGVGKTYLMAAMANKLIDMNYQVTLFHVPSFIAGLSSHFGDNSLNQEIDKLKSVDVLMLDDIGAESLSQWSRDDVLGVILQARMENQLPTIFSSNFSFQELEEHFAETKNNSEPVKAARLMERIKFLATEVVMQGINRRNS